ncbi:PREDICTED: kappa-type opioid receptor-like [Priapulus caudatus]|uniref:Kappa-type opioid receptor-like n=1 Tax=Priapulus caudatus TaxID=37621 RepID=A0ABM1ENG8_PRICU|nr:PREDICTED: kappa-type opioid receptor-like [Priapulus caudatus]
MEPRNYTVLDDNGTIDHITNHTNSEIQASHNSQANVGFLYSAFVIVVAITILVLNALIMVVYVRFDFLRTQRNYFIINLACADTLFAVAAGATVSLRAFVHEYHATKIACGIFVFVAFVTIGASMLTIGLATLDRYIAIVHPFRYSQLMTPRAAKFMLLSVWLYTTGYGSIAVVQAITRWRPGMFCVVDMITNKWLSWYVAINYAAVLLFMTYAYVVIGRIMIDHSRRVAAATNQAQLQQLSSLAGTFKAAKLILTVVGVSILLISPNILHTFLATSIVETHPRALNALRYIRVAAVFVNMLLNPIMYFMKYDEFSVAIKKLLGRYRARVEPATIHASHIRENLAQVDGQISEAETGQMSHSEGQVSYKGGNVSHSGGQVSHSGGQVTQIQGQMTHSGGQVTHRERHVSPTGGEVSHIGGQVTLIKGQVTHNGEQVTHGEGHMSPTGEQV